MFCSLSGDIPKHPVVSKISGHLFDKSVLLAYIKSHSACPITGKSMSEDDIVEVQSSKFVKPRPVSANSIPSLLQSFQNEWEEIILENFTLKQHLESTRQELTEALYHHDAACRVIARLIKERDEARILLNSQSGTKELDVENNNNKMDVVDTEDVGPLSGAVLADITNKCAELSQARKQRSKSSVSPSVASREQVSNFSTTNTYTPHKSDKPAITSIAHHPTQLWTVATGGADKHVVVSNCQNGTVHCRLSGHSKGITSVSYGNSSSNFILSSSHDKQVKVWKEVSDDYSIYENTLTLSHHTREVVEVNSHPTGNYALTVSKDSSWAFVDIQRGMSIRKIQCDESLNCGKFHPDGLIMSTGSDNGVIKVWDVREQKTVASLNDLAGNDTSATNADSENIIHTINFSENGYHLASCSSAGNIRLWDLRKLKTSQYLENVADPYSVSFDYSGQYLAYSSGTSVKALAVKDWTEILSIEAHKKTILSLCWGPNANYLTSVSGDRSIKVHSLAV